MRKKLSLTVLIMGSVVLISFQGPWHGETAEHHGYKVELSGNISDCLVCHDGTIAPISYFCTRNCNYRTAHSVQKQYPPRGQEKSYASVESILEKGIRLYDGKTTCLSCHDLKNRANKHLVIENNNSNLCYACHVRK